MNTAVHIVAVWSPGSSADPHLEIAVYIKFQYEAVAAFPVCRPGRPSPARTRLSVAGRLVSRDPNVVPLVYINTVLAVWPNTASLCFTFTTDETGIRGTAPGS